MPVSARSLLTCPSSPVHVQAPSQVSTDLGGDPNSKLPSWKISSSRRNAEPFVPEVQPQTAPKPKGGKPKGGSLIKTKMIARTVSRVFNMERRRSSQAAQATAAAAAAVDDVTDEKPVAALEKEEQHEEEVKGEEEDVPVTRGSFALSNAALAELPKSANAEEVGAEAGAKQEEEEGTEVGVEAENTDMAKPVESAVEETRDAQSVSIEVAVPPTPSASHQLSDTAPLPPSRQSSEMVTAPRESTDMSMAAASSAPLIKSGSKASHVFGSMSVTVGHSGFASGHPLFSVAVTVDGEAKEGFGRTGDRFATYRNLAIQLDLIDVTECPFPRTFLKNKFGVKLTQSEIDERASALQTWFNSLVEADLPKVSGWGVYCYDFLLLPIAPSVSCSCVDALNTPNSELPPSPAVSRRLPLSAIRLSLLLNHHPKHHLAPPTPRAGAGTYGNESNGSAEVMNALANNDIESGIGRGGQVGVGGVYGTQPMIQHTEPVI